MVLFIDGTNEDLDGLNTNAIVTSPAGHIDISPSTFISLLS